MDKIRNLGGNINMSGNRNRGRTLKLRWLALLLAVIFLTACGGEASKNYEVLVNDEAGKPVSGVMVQFCSDTECMLGKTEENGIAIFEREAGSYTVHVLKVPDGYAADDTEYPAPEKPGRITIVLK